MEQARQLVKVDHQPIRLQHVRACFDSKGKLAQFSHKLFFLFGCQEIQPLLAEKQTDPFFAAVFFNAAYPCMGILDVKDRVICRFFLRQLNIKIKVTVQTPRKEKEPRNILAYLVNDLPQTYKFPSARGHRYGLAASQKGHQLYYEYIKGFRVVSQRLDGGFHSTDITVMIRPQQVYEMRIPPSVLVKMISDIRRQIGIRTVTFYNDPVLVITKAR
jgi:hypothetical protein